MFSLHAMEIDSINLHHDWTGLTISISDSQHTLESGILYFILGGATAYCILYSSLGNLWFWIRNTFLCDPSTDLALMGVNLTIWKRSMSVIKLKCHTNLDSSEKWLWYTRFICPLDCRKSLRDWKKIMRNTVRVLLQYYGEGQLNLQDQARNNPTSREIRHLEILTG